MLYYLVGNERRLGKSEAPGIAVHMASEKESRRGGGWEVNLGNRDSKTYVEEGFRALISIMVKIVPYPSKRCSQQTFNMTLDKPDPQPSLS